MPPFYVTTPIYYVNDAPHIGHAYTTVAADALARWHRLNGRETFFLTGTDEHGQKVQRAADKLGRTPQAHADEMHLRFKALWARLDIQYDDFIRTTEPRHVAFVQDLLQKLHDRGELYQAPYSGWYSTSAERFWTDEEVAAAGGLCPDTGSPVEWLTEHNWFFRMSAYQERLMAHIAANPSCIQPDTRRNEVLGYLRKPLADLCISRPKTRLAWGIPLPFSPDYVTYVWFDALSNYVSALQDPPARMVFWPEALQLVGKDILTFHTVYWFSMLMAAGMSPPKQVYAHGWWLMTGKKMSKSIGNVIKPDAMIDAYGADALRYFLLAAVPFGGDGEFTHEAFLHRYNSDLANDIGNLSHRATSMPEKWLGSVVPAVGVQTEEDRELQAVAVRATSAFTANMEIVQFKAALEGLWELVRAGNKYIDSQAPWALNKRGETERLGTVLRNVMEVVRVAYSYLACVTPGKSREVLSRLGATEPDLDPTFDRLVTGHPVSHRDPIFLRLDAIPESLVSTDPVVPAAAAAPPPAAPPVAAPPADEPAAPVAQIEYDDFAKLQLRTGLVLTADKHPKADRLLVLSVDIGEGKPRTIVAGIAAVYDPAELVGKTVIVVANLKPAKLRGIESQGMLLAAGGSDIASILTPYRPVPPGSVVK
ncbi:MAG: methionine--tRNA ligase [Myxococcales bacterium]|nr:methionine--tRNA ligase [Myxococcales bacterium]